MTNMNKQKSIKILLTAAMTLLVAAFLFLGFFVSIIVYCDIIDIRNQRLDTNLIVKDLILSLVWLTIIPTFFFLKKKYKIIK